MMHKNQQGLNIYLLSSSLKDFRLSQNNSKDYPKQIKTKDARKYLTVTTDCLSMVFKIAVGSRDKVIMSDYMDVRRLFIAFLMKIIKAFGKSFKLNLSLRSMVKSWALTPCWFLVSGD